MSLNDTRQTTPLSARLAEKYGPQNETYVRRLRLIYDNLRDGKPYPNAKSDLGEYIRLAEKKPGEMGGEGVERFQYLGNLLEERGIIDDGILSQMRARANAEEAKAPERVKDRVVSIHSNGAAGFTPKETALIGKVGVRDRVRGIMDPGGGVTED